jgi:hypothetical protein
MDVSDCQGCESRDSSGQVHEDSATPSLYAEAGDLTCCREADSPDYLTDASSVSVRRGQVSTES